MKFKQYLALIADEDGYFPTPRLRQIIRTNARKTAREEAIAAEIIKKANPRQNITGRFPWGAEEQLVLQQMWMNVDQRFQNQWRDVPIEGAEDLYTVEETEFGELPVPNAVKEPGQVRGDFEDRIKEALGEDHE